MTENTAPRFIALDIHGQTVADGMEHLITRDTLTGLEWTDATAGKPRPHEEAMAACEAVQIAGGGWRAPTRLELQSFLDLTIEDPAFDQAAFPFVRPTWYWSSDLAAWSSATTGSPWRCAVPVSNSPLCATRARTTPHTRNARRPAGQEDPMHITSKVADALRAFAASPTGELVRCSGGYRPAGLAPNAAVRHTSPITMRTIRAMNNEWLVKLHGCFSSGAELTDKGRSALEQLQAAEAAKASKAGAA